MKLKTEMFDAGNGQCFANYSDDGSGLDHDAAAAHALMQAIHNRIDRARDAGQHYSSRRLEGIIQYADEIMREWGWDNA